MIRRWKGHIEGQPVFHIDTLIFKLPAEEQNHDVCRARFQAGTSSSITTPAADGTYDTNGGPKRGLPLHYDK